MKKLKRKYRLTVIFLSISIITGVLMAFLINHDSEEVVSVIMGGGLLLIGFTIIGSLLFLNGLHLQASEGGELRKEDGDVVAFLGIFLGTLGAGIIAQLTNIYLHKIIYTAIYTSA